MTPNKKNPESVRILDKHRQIPVYFTADNGELVYKLSKHAFCFYSLQFGYWYPCNYSYRIYEYYSIKQLSFIRTLITRKVLHV